MTDQSDRARQLDAAAEAIVDRAPALDETVRHYLATVLRPEPRSAAPQRQRAA